MRALFFAHSGLRYLVLLAGIVALVYAARAVLAGKDGGRGGRATMAAFLGLLDLQIVLGLIMVGMGAFYTALAGHFITMIIAAAAGHASSLFARRSVGAKADKIRLAGLIVTLALIVLGILAIGRSVFGMGSPTFG
jgi:hypothetical protein